MKQHYVIVGLGKSGYSCVEYLAQRDCQITVMDQQSQPALLSNLQLHYPKVSVCLGKMDADVLRTADEIIVSPGVSLQQPALQSLLQQGKSIIGDIELFLREAAAPIIAITGSNGKTTVTTLMGEMINQAGKTAIACGNIGTPVLDQLAKPVPDYYVLELSSFQLETVYSLKAKVAVILNICEDHMDRYDSLQAYLQAKQRVYRDCEVAVINHDEPQCWRQLPLPDDLIGFASEAAENVEFYIEQDANQFYLAHKGERLLNTSSLALQGWHHWLNALACLAMGSAIRLPMPSMIATLTAFAGLPHRCQLVSDVKQVRWINDSKGTNVGASIAAIKSVAAITHGRIFLIAGGDAKSADVSALHASVAQHVEQVFLLGKDAALLEAALQGASTLTRVNQLEEAVTLAAQLARAGDTVLLSPACASWDMFDNYQQRGECFVAAVRKLDSESA